MNKLNYILSAVGGYVIYLLGGADDQLTALVVLMVLDIISGFLAGCIGQSLKSESGYLSSKAMGAGIIKKTGYFICVIVAVILERSLGLSFVRQVVLISFIISECLSVLENCNRLGIRIPRTIYNALDILRKRGGADGPAGDPQEADGDDDSEGPEACG